MTGPLTAGGEIRNPLETAQREIAALARRADPGSASWQSAKHAILEAANYLRQEADQTDLPIDLGPIATFQGIRRVESLHGRDAPHAVLVPTLDGFTVRLSGGHAEVRNRASLAHEIGHTFFYDLSRRPPTRILVRSRSGLVSAKEEDVCKTFARELLVPRQLIGDRDEKITGDELQLLSVLASRFKVSIEFMAVRLLWDCGWLGSTVALFAEANIPQPTNARIRPRKYHGQNVKRLRLAESRLIHDVIEALVESSRFGTLGQIAQNHEKVASLVFKIEERQDWKLATVLVRFPRNRA